MLHNQPHYLKHTRYSHQGMYSSEKVLRNLCCLSDRESQNIKDLRKREAILDRLVNNIPGALYQASSDRNWTMEFISPAIFQMSGYPASDFINNRIRSWASIIHPEDKNTIALILEENLAQKSPYHLEYRIQREDGVWIWVSEKGQGIFDEKGNLICLNGMIFGQRDRDDGDTKATELSTRLTMLLETIRDFVSLSDATGRFIYINRAGRKLVGLREDEDIRNLRIGDFCTSKSLEIILREGLPKAEENGLWRGETELLPRKGESIPVSQVIMAHKSMTGEVEMFSSIVLNLREHLELEKALRLSETKNRNLLTAIPDVIFQLNEQGILLEYMPPRCNILDPHLSSFLEEGISPNDILGKSIEALFPQELAQWMRHYLELTLKTGQPQLGEYLWQVKTADIGTETHWNHYEARYIPSGNNEILVMVRDITERKRLEAELRISQVKERERSLQLEKTLNTLRQTQSQLIQSEKMSALGRIVAGISHEINNPLNFISGNIDYATSSITDILELVEAYQKYHPHTCEEIQELSEVIDVQFIKEDLPKLLSSMKMGVHRIQEIVRATRNFSRKDESEKKFVNLHEGLESTLQILQYRLKSSTAGKPGLQLIKNYGELPKIECYAGLINQVFMNILDNGIDALENLKNNTKTPTIVITTELLDQEVIIKIEDNGSGITPEVQKHIFDPFFTTKPVGKGAGLGLAISYAIVVEKHQGRLQCFSTPEEGTKFIIELPLFHP
jgi:two-component system, NtrC family, sensor kinase